MNYHRYRNEIMIINAWDKLTAEQTQQLLWIYVARQIPNFVCLLGIDSQNKKVIRTYLNLLGLSFGIAYKCILDPNYNTPLQNRDIEYVEKIVASFTASDYKLQFTKRAGLYANALAHLRTHKKISVDTLMTVVGEKGKDRLLDDIICLKDNDSEALYPHFDYTGDGNITMFHIRMHDMQLGYWSSWFVRLAEDHFVPSSNGVEYVVAMPVELILGDALTAIKWLEELEAQGAQHLNEARIILLGEKGAGKTSLARRLVDPYSKMPEEQESTEGVDITSFTLKDIYPDIPDAKNANVYIWDFAGHSITHAVHRCFLSERCIYVILYDGRTEGRNRLDYWLNHVRNYGGDSKVYILANIKDGNKPSIEENYIRHHYAQHKCEFSYFSIKNDYELLQQFRVQLALQIKDDPAWGQNIPITYYHTKEALKKAFSGNRDYISLEEFNKIACGGSPDMLKALHSLGICLYYEDIDKLNTLVLNPRWITWGIYHIISWLKNTAESYQLKLETFSTIFADNLQKYPVDKHSFLYQLMIKYELAYEDSNKGILIVPQCLGTDQPSQFPPFPLGERLYTRFDAKQKGDDTPMPFPPDIMPRIIVKRSDDAANGLSEVWRYGALLYLSSDTYAHIQQKDSVILLIVAGEERTIYHDILRGVILDIIRTYTSFQENDPEIKYELIEHPNIMYPQNSLVNLLVNHMATYDDVGLGKTIDVKNNASQYKIIIDNRTINISSPTGPVILGDGTASFDIAHVDFGYSRTVMRNRLDEFQQLLASAGEECPKEVKQAGKMLSKYRPESACKKDNKLKSILKSIRDQLADEESTLHKVANSLTKGAKLIAEFIEAYNNFANACGWK